MRTASLALALVLLLCWSGSAVAETNPAEDTTMIYAYVGEEAMTILPSGVSASPLRMVRRMIRT